MSARESKLLSQHHCCNYNPVLYASFLMRFHVSRQQQTDPGEIYIFSLDKIHCNVSKEQFESIYQT